MVPGETEGADSEVLVVGITAAQLEQPFTVGGQRPREVDSGVGDQCQLSGRPGSGSAPRKPVTAARMSISATRLLR